MNINKVDGNVHTKQIKTTRKVAEGKKFDEILNDALDGVAREKHAPAKVSPVKETTLPAASVSGPVDHMVFQKASTILDLLEEYSDALKNPRMTLKGIEPIVTRIERELKGLDVQSIASSGKNHELVNIMNEIVATASVETFKFQRGDYLP